MPYRVQGISAYTMSFDALSYIAADGTRVQSLKQPMRDMQPIRDTQESNLYIDWDPRQQDHTSKIR